MGNKINNGAFEKKQLKAKLNESGIRKSQSRERSSLSRRQKKNKNKRRGEEIVKQNKRKIKISRERGDKWEPNKKESKSQSLKVASGSDQGPDATKIKIYRETTHVKQNNENYNTAREKSKINDQKKENEARTKEDQIDSNLKFENDESRKINIENPVNNNLNNNKKDQDSDLEDEKDSLLDDMSEGEVAMQSPQPKAQHQNQTPQIHQNEPLPIPNGQPQLKNETNTKSSKNLASTTERPGVQESQQTSTQRAPVYLSSKTDLPTDPKPKPSKYDPFNPVKHDSPLYTVERSNKNLKRASKKARSKSRAKRDVSNEADLKEISRDKRDRKSKSRSRSRSKSGQEKRDKKRKRKRDMFEEMGIRERRQKERRRKKKKKRSKEEKMNFDEILNRFDKKQKKSRKRCM